MNFPCEARPGVPGESRRLPGRDPRCRPPYLHGQPAVPHRAEGAAAGEQQLAPPVERAVPQLAAVLGAGGQRVGAQSLHPTGEEGRSGPLSPRRPDSPRRSHLPRSVSPQKRLPVTSMAALRGAVVMATPPPG